MNAYINSVMNKVILINMVKVLMGRKIGLRKR